MTQVCKDCTVSRWGGEEFLIYGEEDSVSTDIIEQLRKTVEDFTLTLNDQSIKFTITAGVSAREDRQTMDKWIISADNKLYSGKASGRNKVVY
ncbi:MAG: diguanylate cyclase [Treponema sp.]|nr:diguanylate cyclase [Treponema sp.]